MSAHTSPFHPKTTRDLNALLLGLNLSEDLGFNTAADGQVSFYALEGARSWPCEWTPNRDDVFEEFHIDSFLHLVAAGGQEIEATENGQTLVITLGT